MLSDPNLREGIKKFSNWPTIPQVRSCISYLPQLRMCLCWQQQPRPVPSNGSSAHGAHACMIRHDEARCTRHSTAHMHTGAQVFVKSEFVGGADILMNMHNNGELEQLLGPIVKAQAGSK